MKAPIFPPDPLPPIIVGGSVNILAGASGTGKTALIASWAKAMRDKTPINGYMPDVVTDIALLSADRSYFKSTKQWFDLVGFGDIKVYSIQDDLGFNLQRLRKKQDRVSILDSCLELLKLRPHALVYIDPIGLFLGGNLLDYDTCLVACSEIRRMCLLRQITIIGLAHAAKQIADMKQRYLRLQDRIAGSTAIFGYSDTQIYFASPKELSTKKDPVSHYTLYWNPHHSPEETFALTRDPETGLFSEGVRITDEDPASAVEDLLGRARRLLEFITADLTGTDYADLMALVLQRKDLGVKSDRTLRRYLALLIEVGDIERMGKGAYRKCPEPAPPLGEGPAVH